MVLMSTFNRLLGMASKALGSQQNTGQSQNGTDQSQGGANQAGGGTDWRTVVRAAADRITGDERQQQGAAQSSAPRNTAPASPSASNRPQGAGAHLPQNDRAALARYDYLLRTAPPERLEQVHQEAFARLTPEQRAIVLERLSGELPAGERPRSADSAELARAATRGEVSKPGLMKRVLGSGAGRGVGAGALAGVGVAAAGGLAVAIAGGAIASAAAGPILAEAANLGVDFMGLADVGDGLTASVEGLAGDLGTTASEAVAGGTEALGGIGEQASDLASGFGLPGLGDLFGDR